MRAAYEVVRKQVKDAAREKGVRRGVRSMFDTKTKEATRGSGSGAGTGGWGARRRQGGGLPG